MNWTALGGIQVNGSGYYSGSSTSATISTQNYGGLLLVDATNACGTSPSITIPVYTPYVANTTINGSNGSTATVSYVATMALQTNNTATGGNWVITNGNGSISQYGTSCNTYPNDFLRVIGTPTNQYGSGQTWTFYIFKEGYSGYRMAYPNPAKEQINIDFDDAQLAQELLQQISLLDEKGKTWKTFNTTEAKSGNYFQKSKRITFDVKDVPRGTYYMKIKLGEKSFSDRIIIE